MRKIKTGDEVVVLTGRDKGRRGTVNRVLKDGRYLVSGVNMIKKHQRANPQQGVAGGRIEKEAPIAVSNLAIFNPQTEKADRVRIEVAEDGTKVRVFKSNGERVGS